MRAPGGRLLAYALASVAVVALAGCASTGPIASGPLPRIPIQSPIATAQSWFKALNDHNMALAQAHFSPGSRDQMEWSNFDSARFSNVRCRQVSGSLTSSNVRCTFGESGISGIPGSGTSFWTISFERQPPGPWLITTYGQP